MSDKAINFSFLLGDVGCVWSMANREYNLEKLNRSKKLSVPAWGPYGRRYAGVTHLLHDCERSVDFMLAFCANGCKPVLPGFLEKENCRFHSYHAAPGLSHFTYKFDLLGIDELYSLVEFSPGIESCLMDVKVKNNTLIEHIVDMEILPAVAPEPRQPPSLRLHPGDIWISAEEYTDLITWARRMDDGFRNLVMYDPNAVNSRCLSGRWAALPGTRVEYRTHLKSPVKKLQLGIRYQKDTTGNYNQAIFWGDKKIPLNFPETSGYQWHWTELGRQRPGTHKFGLSVDRDKILNHSLDPFVKGNGQIRIDGFALCEKQRDSIVTTSYNHLKNDLRVELIEPQTFAISFGSIEGVHVIQVPSVGKFDVLHATPVLFSEEVNGRPLDIENRNGCIRVSGLTVPRSGGTRVNLELAYGNDLSAALSRLKKQKTSGDLRCLISQPLTGRFAFGKQLLAANCLTNIAYPCFLPKEVVATYTPGKIWGGFYSWDSGMHGLGLLELDVNAAVECLNVYLCGPDDEADFIWHGTPLPVQAYLLNEIWMLTRDRDLLHYFYSRIRRFYDYLLGHAKDSPTNRFGCGLLNTYPLFYNTGGWDDLPPQVEVHRNGLEDDVSPVSTTAHAVRFSRFMIRFAEELGYYDHISAYRMDVKRGISAIERTWDPAELVYSYVYHQTFRPLRHESGDNYNHTLDGLSPLIAGGITPTRAQRLLERLGSPGRYWSSVGITTVDQASPYYDPNGYWNGSVWIPHQWFLWRSVLDWGILDLALLIPRTAAEVWEREARRTHCSAEYFKVDTGVRGGYPHFAGLSAPLLNMISAISMPGKVTSGFDVEIRFVRLNENMLSFEYKTNGSTTFPGCLSVMPSRGEFRIEFYDGTVKFVESSDLGCLAFHLRPCDNWCNVCVSPTIY